MIPALAALAMLAPAPAPLPVALSASPSVALSASPPVALSASPPVALSASPPADADVLCLKDGRVVQGPTMARTDKGIELTYPHGKILVPSSMILDAMLAADSKVSPATDEEKDMAAKGLVRFEGKWVLEKRRDEILQKRLADHRKEIEQLAARKEWRSRGIQETPHFRFEYTVPDGVFEDFRDTMEAYYAEFTKAWKLSAPKKQDKLPVCLHANEESFHQVSGAGYGVLGWFRPIKPYDLNIYYERLDPALSIEVMFHESNHYLQRLIEADFLMPHFPGESLAEYYGASRWDPVKKKLITGLVLEGRLSEVQEDIARGEIMDLDRMLKTPRMYQHYTWGWSLVHFLMNDPKYQPKFQKFMFTLARSKDVKREPVGIQGLKTVTSDEVERVFLQELGLKDAAGLRKLETEWHDYVKGLKSSTLRGLEESGMSAAQVGRPLRAMRILKEAIDGGSQNPIVFHRYAGVLLLKQKREEAIAAWRQAIEIDPLNGEFYASIGHAMKMKFKEKKPAQKKEGDPATESTGGGDASAEPKPEPKPEPKNGEKPDGAGADGGAKPEANGGGSGEKTAVKDVKSDVEADRLIGLGKDLGFDEPWLDLDFSSPEGGDSGEGR